MSTQDDGGRDMRRKLITGAAPAELLGTLRRESPRLGGTLMYLVGNGRPAVLKTAAGTAAAGGYRSCGPRAGDDLTAENSAQRHGCPSPRPLPAG